MFGCFGAEVTKLNRICMENLELPKDLEKGKFREATDDELDKIQEK